MSQSIELSDLQISMMRVLWREGEASAADVHRALLNDRDLAFTSVSTMLNRLEKKGLITHRKEGRQFIFRALVSEEKALQSDMEALMGRWFSGSAPVLVNHLLKKGDIGDDDLDRIKAMIAQARENEVTS